MRITAQQASEEMNNAEGVVNAVLDQIDLRIKDAASKGIGYIAINTDDMAVDRILNSLKERGFDCSVDPKREKLSISWDGLPF